MDSGRGELFRVSGRTNRILLATVVGLVSFGTAGAVASVVSGEEDASATLQAGEAKQKDWKSVAEGQDPAYGRYEVFRAYVGDEDCVGLRLKDREPPGGGGAIYNFCGGSPTLDASYLVGSSGTLVYGRAGSKTRTVKINVKAKEAKDAAVVEVSGTDTKYFVGVVPGREDVSVEAKGANGQTLKSNSGPPSK